jgi:leader peptidase (prepilin peptidase) / N-methyltransferase
MPREISVVSPRSACPTCEKPIAAYDNIPVLSWVMLRGRCRNCQAPISPRYAVVELLTGALFVLSFLASSGHLPGVMQYVADRCPLLINAKPVEIFDLNQWLAPAIRLCVLSFLLLGLIFTDAETQLLPDLLTKPGIILGLGFSLLVPLLDFCVPAAGNWRIQSLLNSAAGAFLGWAIIFSIALLYEAIRGTEGMGGGDVKLMALIGAFLGMKLTLLVLLLASFFGSLFGGLLVVWVWAKRVRRRRNPAEQPSFGRSRAWQSAKLIPRHFPIPFGVFLGAAALFCGFWGLPLICKYAEYARLPWLCPGQ